MVYIMKYTKELRFVRHLATGKDFYDDAFYDWLLKNHCYYLLSKSKRYSERTKLFTILNAAVIHQRYNACGDLFAQLERLPYASIKGATLSSRIYGTPFLRYSGDIDLLIPPSFVDAVKKILLENGFIQGRVIDQKIVPYTRKEQIYQRSLTHQLASFTRETGKEFCPFVNIDVNQSILWGETDLVMDMEAFMTHTEEYQIYDIPLRRLTPVWEFLSLCMHHYKDMNSIYLIADRGLSLSEYCDIYYYLINVAPDGQELANASKRYKISDYIYYCVYYAYKIFSDDRLLNYLYLLDSPSAQELIDCYGLNADERQRWTSPFWERLFDDTFKDRFFDSLTQSQKRKVEINRQFM